VRQILGDARELPVDRLQHMVQHGEVSTRLRAWMWREAWPMKSRAPQDRTFRASDAISTRKI
jgi:hypothetical protein